MIETKSLEQKDNNNSSNLIINSIFAFFPISFIMGSLIVNLNLLLICSFGIYYLRSKLIKDKFDFVTKIIFLFFFILFFSTCLSLAKSLYFNEYNEIYLSKLIKSLLFFRFFLFLIIVSLLTKYNILRFRYFFLAAGISSIVLASDMIFQHLLGFNILGFESQEFRASSFYGDEYVAGGHIQRFGFFAIFLALITFKNKSYTQFTVTTIVVCVLFFSILFSGNRMPLILFLFGLLIILISGLKMRKILLASSIIIFLIFQFMISVDEKFKKNISNEYSSFFGNAANTLLSLYGSGLDELAEGRKKSSFSIDTRIKRADVEYFYGGQKTTDVEMSISQKTTFLKGEKTSFYRKAFLASIYTWKNNKIFGNGIKSFYTDCHNLKKSNPKINLEEDEYHNKINLSCSNHPHNYYFQILTTAGIAGLLVVFVTGLLFIFFIFKNIKFLKRFDMHSIILLSTSISFFIEIFPIRSSGSLYTSNNATYVVLVGAIILGYKELLKVK